MRSFRNFPESELACSCCGKLNPNPEFYALMDDVQAYRDFVGRPVILSSAYRCPEHPIEAAKEKPGMHSFAAVDLAESGANGINCMKFFFNLGYVGVGVQQKGRQRFIHIDTRTTPALWSY